MSLGRRRGNLNSSVFRSPTGHGPPMVTQKQHLDFFHSTTGQLIFFAAAIIILLFFAFTLAGNF
jgi:hypothetical protein